MPDNHPHYDVIIWGATGFTGRLVAEYYLTQYGVSGELRWAMAGRNLDKLHAVRDSLGNNDIPLLVADINDPESLAALVKQTNVICSTVGPYAKYGSQMVAACVEHGIDYCDLAGESHWIHQMIEQHHEAAQQKGVRIVHSCGFDSIPSDMGVYFLQQHCQREKGRYCNRIKLRVKRMKGGFSGGTYNSIINLLDATRRDRAIRRIIANPYGLNPKGMQSGLDRRDLRHIAYDRTAKSWIMPFIMEGINSRIVRRSHALSGFPYGKNFRYDEAMMTGSGLKGQLRAIAGSIAIGALLAGKPTSTYRKLVNRLLPHAGEGPSKHERESGHFTFLLFGSLRADNLNTDNLNTDNLRTNNAKPSTSSTQQKPSEPCIIAKVTGDRDPGYGSTSKMLGEAAACLACDREKTADISGVITPAIAMGEQLLSRLTKNAGITFTIESV